MSSVVERLSAREHRVQLLRRWKQKLGRHVCSIYSRENNLEVVVKEIGDELKKRPYCDKHGRGVCECGVCHECQEEKHNQMASQSVIS